MVKLFLKLDIDFYKQQHIIELDNNGLLYDYIKLISVLARFKGRYIHKKKYFMADLSHFTQVGVDSLRKIIIILKKHKMFYYNYDTAFFNESGLTFGNTEQIKTNKEELPITERNQQESNDSGINDEDWKEMTKL